MITAQSIDALLPQTQCGECGFHGCMPYAQAIAVGAASIDRCPPGGVPTLVALANLLKIDAEPFMASVQANTRMPSQAVIRESDCIGCTKCIQACPVDAIIGTAKKMHSVLVDDCTGCGLCVAPCPVDCIELVEIPQALYDKNRAREQFHARAIRLLRDEQAQQQAYREKRMLAEKSQDKQQDKQSKQAYILQALNRSVAKKNE